MEQDWTGILWPSLGYPQGVGSRGAATDTLTAIVLRDHRRDALEVAQISAQLHPTIEIKDTPIHLDCLAVARASLEQFHHLGRWSSWIEHQTTALWRLDFQVPPVPLPEMRRTVLCDLEVRIDGEHVVRPGAVYLQRHKLNTTAILLATDIHVARRWEWISQDVHNVFPSMSIRRYENLDALVSFDPAEAWSRECFLHSFINPNQNLASLIRTANRMAERGNIDCVWLTGDLVDYKYSRPKAESGDDFEHTEWSFLKALLLGETGLAERLCVPIYMLTGNHDYRLYPYHLQTYGLRHCGVADELTQAYLRRVGAWRRLKYRASDLNAIRINRSENHSLKEYHREFNPFTDYTVHFDDLKVVALDTGHDFFCDFSHLRNSRRRRFLKGIQDSLHAPYSNGFSKQQIQYFKDACEHDQQKPLLVMAHTPLLNPYVSFDQMSGANREAVLPLKLDERFLGHDDESSIRFEEEAARAKLDNGTVFQNPLSFLKTLQTYQHQVVVLSGHNHEQVELGLEKQNGQFYQSEYSRSTNLQRILDSHALLVQTPALGHLKMEPTKTGFPAYRTIMSSKHSIDSLNVVHLDEGDSDFWFYDWEMTEAGSRDLLTLSFRSSRNIQGRHRECIHKVVIWRRPRRRGKSRYKPLNIVIPESDNDAVLEVVDRQHPSEGGYVVILSRHVPYLSIQLANRPSGIRLAFLFETFEDLDGHYMSLGMKRHPRDLIVRL